MPVLAYILTALGAYLLGSIPFGFLMARAKGIDIRQVGSGNIGATNVFRCIGKPLGILTFVLDLAKGYAGCTLIPLLAIRCPGVAAGHSLSLCVACGFAAVAGHNWPVYLGFKGGKGVATSAGLLLGLAPAGCGLALGVWIVIFLSTRYVSVASIAAAVSLGAAAWLPFCRHDAVWFPVMLDVLALLVVWKHRANIRRLCAGTESRFQFGRKT